MPAEEDAGTTLETAEHSDDGGGMTAAQIGLVSAAAVVTVVAAALLVGLACHRRGRCASRTPDLRLELPPLDDEPGSAVFDDLFAPEDMYVFRGNAEGIREITVDSDSPRLSSRSCSQASVADVHIYLIAAI